MNIADLRYRSWAVATAILVGCAAQPSPNSSQRLLPQTADRGNRAPTSYVFAAECCRYASGGANVTLYDLGLTGVARRITKGLTSPDLITVDASGRLYVIMDQDFYGVVTEYDRGSLSPSRRLASKGAWAVATDSSNNAYVAVCPSCHEYGFGKSSVDVYEAGSARLLRTITNGVHLPRWVAIDSKDNLYVADSSYAHPAIAVYAPGASKPLRKLTQGLTVPAQVVFDPSNNVFVINNGGTGSQYVVEYEAASDKLLRTITNGIQSPQAIATDGSGTLYVANANGSGSGWVSIYPSGASTPSYKIDVENPISLTTDAQDNLYVANVGYNSPIHDRRAVCVYAPNTRKALRCVPAQRRYDLPTWLAAGP